MRNINRSVAVWKCTEFGAISESHLKEPDGDINDTPTIKRET